MNNSDKLLSH